MERYGVKYEVRAGGFRDQVLTVIESESEEKAKELAEKYRTILNFHNWHTPTSDPAYYTLEGIELLGNIKAKPSKQIENDYQQIIENGHKPDKINALDI